MEALNIAQDNLKEAERNLQGATNKEEREFWRKRVEAREAQVNKLQDALIATAPGNDFVTRGVGDIE